MSKVTVIGLGYIGLPTATVLANAGHTVLGVDINEGAVNLVNEGRIHFVEPSLEDEVRRAVDNGNLRASTTVEPAETFIITVPTPIGTDRTPNLKFIEQAVASIAPVLVTDDLVVLESTSPPGTTANIEAQIRTLRPDLVNEDGQVTVLLAHAPERVLPGNIVREIRENDRIVGGTTPEATARVASLYKSFTTGEVLTSDATTAELAKLAENSFRDVNIAFANELSLISAELNVDVWEVIKLANRHPRVNIMQPGPGVGGHCIAVDPWFIVDSAPIQSKLIRTAREVNDSKPEWVLQQIAAAHVNNPGAILVLGLAFKADVDDLRESPSLAIAQRVVELYPTNEVVLSEPNISELPEDIAMNANVRLSTDLEADIAASSLVILLVDHRQYRDLNRNVLIGKTVIDTKGLWQ